MEFNQMKQKANFLFIVACSALLALVRGQGEYQVILSQPDSRVDSFDVNVVSTWLENENDPSASTFTNIGNLDPADYIDDEGYYRFMMVYINLDESTVALEWKQNTWLTAKNEIPGLVPINVPPQNFNPEADEWFRGLGPPPDPDANALMGIGPWNNAGRIQPGGTPGFNGEIAYSTTLYAARTIVDPTTADPTTADPTTAAPTSATPTTADPTTADPTTAAPTSATPTTAGPTTAAPTSATPTTADPTTAAPTSATPTPTRQPTETHVGGSAFDISIVNAVIASALTFIFM